MTTQMFFGTLEVHTCSTCGMAFGLENEFDRRRRNDGATFFCPSGHQQCFTKSRVQQLEGELAAKKAALDSAWQSAERLRTQIREKERRASALRGVITRTKRRVGNGVCPCCKRSFAALSAHMKTKHPGYAEAQP